ncbi:MAG: hypothetical protein IJO77_01265 [Oscillospiraceae bacterium]|nr:hypothetical protein [Oscillospiraceae bacterium]
MTGESRKKLGELRLFDVVRLKNSGKYKAMGVPENMDGTIVDIVSNADVCTVEFCDEDGAAYGTCLSEYFTENELVLVSRPWDSTTV